MKTMVKQWIVTVVAVGISFTTVAEAQKAPSENASKVPKFTFSTDSKEQEKQMANNPSLERFRVSRLAFAVSGVFPGRPFDLQHTLAMVEDHPPKQ